MVRVRQIGLALVLILFLSVSVTRPAKAIDWRETMAEGSSVLVRAYEGVEYFFNFGVENKIEVLDKHAEKRLTWAEVEAEQGDEEGVQEQLHDYSVIKDKQDSLIDRVDDVGEVLGTVQNRVIEQQKTMEEIKTKIDEDGKQNVIQVQERVVNQIAKRVIDVNGSEGATEFLNEVVHVWAPGTGPGGDVGVIYEGGGKLMYAPGTGPGGQGGVVIEGGEMRFAPGTSAGGPSGSDIKTVEVKTGGIVNEPVPVGGDMNITTDTVLDGPVNTIDDTYDDNSWTIDP